MNGVSGPSTPARAGEPVGAGRPQEAQAHKARLKAWRFKLAAGFILLGLLTVAAAGLWHLPYIKAFTASGAGLVAWLVPRYAAGRILKRAAMLPASKGAGPGLLAAVIAELVKFILAGTLLAGSFGAHQLHAPAVITAFVATVVVFAVLEVVLARKNLTFC